MAITKTVISSGTILGFETKTPGIAAFLGIPYGAPTDGRRRFSPPLPAAVWDGVRECFDFGMSCWQPDNRETPDYLAQCEKNPIPPRPLRMSEDCLNLNVWTPAKSADESLPVMVWFYGGGLQAGTTDNILFDGEGLCRHGVILVTVNYRTGVFGYIGHDELEAENPHGVCGNYGLLDQLLSLQWVHDNIHAFGGDPGNVTIFGCSGGGRSVQGIACSPRSVGLVHHAICLSAGGLNPYYSLDYTALKERGAEFVAFCGKKHIDDLRLIPARELQIKYEAFQKQFNITGDGWALAKTMDEMVRCGKQADLDYLLSTTANEIRRPIESPVSAAAFASVPFGERTRIFARSVAPKTDEEAMQYAEWAEVYEMKAAQLAWAKAHTSQSKKPVYLASFDHPMPHSGLASHGDDQYYIFGTLHKFWYPATKEDDALSDLMMRIFTAFAKKGDPNGPGLPHWTPYTNKSPMTMSIRAWDDCTMERRQIPEIERLSDIYLHWGKSDPSTRQRFVPGI